MTELRKIRFDWNGKESDVEHMIFEIKNEYGTWKDAIKGTHSIRFK